MWEYDFTRDIKENPKFAGYIGRKDDTHTPLAGTVGAADGCVYNAGITYGRRREGGGFGWYNVKTKEIGGMPIDGHRFFWMKAVADGRYVLLSSKFKGEGMLFCWDTTKRDFAWQKKILDQPTPGPIEEALPGGLVMGHTTATEGDGGLLYGLRADTGEILWHKEVPAGPITAQSRVRRHAYSFRRGPDGHIWAYFGNTLVRINPRNVKVEAVGKIPGQPVQIAFAGGRVYVASGAKLRRIKDLPAVPE
jgi:outer membrane protein assembly factor BamB